MSEGRQRSVDFIDLMFFEGDKSGCDSQIVEINTISINYRLARKTCASNGELIIIWSVFYNFFHPLSLRILFELFFLSFHEQNHHFSELNVCTGHFIILCQHFVTTNLKINYLWIFCYNDVVVKIEYDFSIKFQAFFFFKKCWANFFAAHNLHFPFLQNNILLNWIELMPWALEKVVYKEAAEIELICEQYFYLFLYNRIFHQTFKSLNSYLFQPLF